MRKHTLILTLVISLLSLNRLTAQFIDTSYQESFSIEGAATLDLDFEHSQVYIETSPDNHINITTSLKLMPTNPKAPYAGITRKTAQKGKNNVFVSFLVGDELQPSNELEASYTIQIPHDVAIKIRSRYSDINIAAPCRHLTATTSYSTLKANQLSPDARHIFNADYSEIVLDSLSNSLSIKGQNIKFTAQSLHQLKASTQFSTYKISNAQSILSTSNTDKFLIDEVDSFQLTGEYSSCQINKLNQFLQAEMSYGALTINDINPDFKNINIANSYVNTKLTLDKESHFTINADMRYCQLIQEGIELHEVSSPSDNLIKGIYGLLTLAHANISLISSFGDVKIDFQ